MKRVLLTDPIASARERILRGERPRNLVNPPEVLKKELT